MTQRCFLAITPDPSTRLAVDAWRERAWPDLQRPVPPADYHLTLVFLGNIDSRQRLRLEQAMDTLRGDRPEVQLDDAGYWPATSLAWLGCRVPDPALMALAASCHRLANRIGVRANTRRFTPHLTLARGQIEPPPPPQLPADFQFDADEITLFESLRGRDRARYRTLYSVRI